MKSMITTILFLSFSLSPTVFAAKTNKQLKSGFYQCIKGNNDSICEQKVRGIFDKNRNLTDILVVYAGYCGDQGPFQYPCEDNICGGDSITFTVHDESHYRWDNNSDDFTCEFEWQH